MNFADLVLCKKIAYEKATGTRCTRLYVGKLELSMLLAFCAMHETGKDTDTHNVQRMFLGLYVMEVKTRTCLDVGGGML